MKTRIYIFGLLLMLWACDNNYYEQKFEQEIENEEQQKLLMEDFRINLQKKAYNFVCYEKCENESGVSEEDMNKYGRKIYKVMKKVIKDSLIIQFSFITSCCKEYIAKVEKKGDTLKLRYKNISFKACECYCSYNYQFSLPKAKYQSKFILLGDSLIQR